MLAPANVKPISEYLPVPDEAVLELPLFPIWHALIISPNRERRAADWLIDKAKVPVFWPNYPKQIAVRCHGQSHRVLLRPVTPGLLFVPEDFIDNRRRDEILKLIHAHGFLSIDGGVVDISKADIEKLRGIEAFLNLPPKEAPTFTIGQKVRFIDDLYEGWKGIVFDIADTGRIGVEVIGLFGRVTRVYSAAHKLEGCS